MKKTWDRSAMRFASVRYARRQRMLDVTFENGDHFLVATEALLPWRTNGPLPHAGSPVKGDRGAAGTPDWAKVRIGETGDVLEVPAAGRLAEIPWDRIRSLADGEFRAHLANQAVERGRRIGARIRAMRVAAGLTRAALAQKTGLRRETVAHLEAAEIEPEIDLLKAIALALGGRLRDFAEE
jgi:DNA-binding XRE family transcriptional regulator